MIGKKGLYTTDLHQVLLTASGDRLGSELSAQDAGQNHESQWLVRGWPQDMRTGTERMRGLRYS